MLEGVNQWMLDKNVNREKAGHLEFHICSQFLCLNLMTQEVFMETLGVQSPGEFDSRSENSCCFIPERLLLLCFLCTSSKAFCY